MPRAKFILGHFTLHHQRKGGIPGTSSQGSARQERASSVGAVLFSADLYLFPLFFKASHDVVPHSVVHLRRSQLFLETAQSSTVFKTHEAFEARLKWLSCYAAVLGLRTKQQLCPDDVLWKKKKKKKDVILFSQACGNTFLRSFGVWNCRGEGGGVGWWALVPARPLPRI